MLLRAGAAVRRMPRRCDVFLLPRRPPRSTRAHPRDPNDPSGRLCHRLPPRAAAVSPLLPSSSLLRAGAGAPSLLPPRCRSLRACRARTLPCQKATCRQPALVPLSLLAQTFIPELSIARSIALPVRWTPRGSVDATRGREGGRSAAATTPATTQFRHQSAATRQRADIRASGNLFDNYRIDRP